MSGPNLTPGDPLGGGGDPARHPSGLPALPSSRPVAEPPPRPSGYSEGRRPPGADRLGAAPPPTTRPASTAVGPELELAGWWRRAGAQVIDGILIGIIALLVIVPFGIGAAGADTDEGGIIALIVGLFVAGLVFLLVTLVYAPVMMVSTNGRTVGRMATGIRVVRTDGQPMDFGTAALREVVMKTLAIGLVANSFTFGLASLLDVLWPLWDEENRALHDFPVNTRTVLG